MQVEDIWLNGKHIGTVVEGGYLTFRNEKHIMRKWGAFGLTEEMLVLLRNRGIEEIKFVYKGKRGTVIYFATTSQYLSSKLVFVDNGDKQKFVKLSDMIKVSSPSGEAG